MWREGVSFLKGWDWSCFGFVIFFCFLFVVFVLEDLSFEADFCLCFFVEDFNAFFFVVDFVVEILLPYLLSFHFADGFATQKIGGDHRHYHGNGSGGFVCVRDTPNGCQPDQQGVDDGQRVQGILYALFKFLHQIPPFSVFSRRSMTFTRSLLYSALMVTFSASVESVMLSPFPTMPCTLPSAFAEYISAFL